MNIDDKIIKRARQQYLHEQYLKEDKKLPHLLEDVDSAVQRLKNNIKDTTDPDKKVMLDQMLCRVVSAIGELESAVKSGNDDMIHSAKEVNPTMKNLDLSHLGFFFLKCLKDNY